LIECLKHLQGIHVARLDVIAGSMFCGKSEELLRRLVRACIAGQSIVLVKPHIDNRTTRETFSMVRENKHLKKYDKLTTRVVSSSTELEELIESASPDVLAMDEAQFFEPWIVDTVQKLLDKYHSGQFRIIVSGLDMYSDQKPFGSMPNLMAKADEVQKLKAVCDFCGQDAMLTYRKPGSPSDPVLVGDNESFGACCRTCARGQKSA
jgi:thymidine kinase